SPDTALTGCEKKERNCEAAAPSTKARGLTHSTSASLRMCFSASRVRRVGAAENKPWETRFTVSPDGSPALGALGTTGDRSRNAEVWDRQVICFKSALAQRTGHSALENPRNRPEAARQAEQTYNNSVGLKLA